MSHNTTNPRKLRESVSHIFPMR